MKNILLFCFCILNFASYSQQWDWAIQENVRKFAVDSAGNVFTVGSSNTSSTDSVLKRFDANGTLT